MGDVGWIERRQEVCVPVASPLCGADPLVRENYRVKLVALWFQSLFSVGFITTRKLKAFMWLYFYFY
jgi:hypothetical protein